MICCITYYYFYCLQSSVALIRTRPIIDIKTSIRPSNTIINIDPVTQGCEKDPGANYTCFHFQACCIIESLVRSTQSNVHKLNYIIEAETFPGGRKYSRVFFDNEKSNIVNRTIQLGKDVEDCREHIVYLKNNTRDIQTPIKVRSIQLEVISTCDAQTTKLDNHNHHFLIKSYLGGTY